MGDYLTVSSETNTSLLYSREDVLSVSKDAGVVNQILFQGRSYAGSSLKNYRIVNHDDVVYTKSPLRENPYGIIKTNLGNSGIVSTLYAVYSPKQGLYSPFLNSYFASVIRVNNYLRPLVNKGAKNDMKVRNAHVLTGAVSFPSIQEQRRISDFFSALDSLIAAAERQEALLRRKKQACLQLMFPQEGETEPRLRFAGFSGEWEQRQLGEVVSERNILRSKSAEYPLVSFTVKDGVTAKTERYDREQLVIGDTSKKLYKETRLDDIVYNPANLKFGAIARNKYGNAVFSPIYITLETCPSVVSPAFVEMLVTRRDFINRALKYQQGTVYERMAVSVEDLLKMNIRVPSLLEQHRIGDFFSTLDSLIAAAEKRTASLCELKSAYLQRMFV